jgi:hypothetical protein
MGSMREDWADLDEEEEEEEGSPELFSGQKRIVLRFGWNMKSSVLWVIIHCTL